MRKRLIIVWRNIKVLFAIIAIGLILGITAIFMIFHFILWFLTGRSLLNTYDKLVDRLIDKI